MTQHITEVIKSWKQNVAPIEGKRGENNKMATQK
jgi:hypothetical protein